MKISEAESAVMRVLWERSPQTSGEVVLAFSGRHYWTRATIKTLLNRLLMKDAIQASREGRRYLYSPRLRQEDWLAQESMEMIERLFGGRVAPLVTLLSEQSKLSASDIAELRTLLDNF